MRTPHSALWYPFTPMLDWEQHEQLTIEAADGNYLIDTKGRRYLDGVSSLWTNVHGHRHPAINKAISEQLDKVAHSTLLGLSSSPAAQLAERLVDVTMDGLNHVFYSDSGSTAVEIALKQAFQYWQNLGRSEKQAFIHLKEAYHGDTLGAVAVGGIDIFHKIFGPLLVQTHAIPSPHAYGDPQGRSADACAANSLQALETLLKDKATTIAALIIEPLVQGAGGMLMQPPGYLAAVAELCKRYEVLLIADEVATGFGRTGTLFACEQESVTPDLLCLAKGITGGYLPLAATLSTTAIYEAFLGERKDARTFFHGHTYTGNPLACAAALANLDIFENEQVLEKVQKRIDTLSTGLAALKDHPRIGDIRQRGLMVGIELVESREPDTAYAPELYTGHRVCMALRGHGIIIRNLGDVVVLMPPLSITDAEIETLLAALRTVLDQL